MTQTAIEWLSDQLDDKLELYNSEWLKIQEIFKQAKEMEKQQIVEAHGNQNKKSRGISNYTYILTGEQYYKETYKQ